MNSQFNTFISQSKVLILRQQLTIPHIHTGCAEGTRFPMARSKEEERKAKVNDASSFDN